MATTCEIRLKTHWQPTSHTLDELAEELAHIYAMIQPASETCGEDLSSLKKNTSCPHAPDALPRGREHKPSKRRSDSRHLHVEPLEGRLLMDADASKTFNERMIIVLCRQAARIVFVCAIVSASVAATAFAAEPVAKKDVKNMRGPLDVHAAWVKEIVDTLDLTDAKREEVKKVIDEGHAAWRKWFEVNHEKVALHTKAVRDARASGNKAKLTEAKKSKKVFMHTAPSIFRHPEPVRNALPDGVRSTFDARLKEQIKKVHTRPAARKKPE